MRGKVGKQRIEAVIGIAVFVARPSEHIRPCGQEIQGYADRDSRPEFVLVAAALLEPSILRSSHK
jgi:hypothetical protein